MNTDSLLTWLSWALAVIAAAGLVLAAVAARKLAARIVVLAVAALLFLLVLGVRAQISGIADSQTRPLCAGGVSWFGVHLTGPARLCRQF